MDTAMTSPSSYTILPSPHTACDRKGPGMLDTRVWLEYNEYLVFKYGAINQNNTAMNLECHTTEY